MALNASNFIALYEQSFAKMVSLKYQAQRRMKSTVRELHGLTGDAYKDKFIDQFQMTNYGAEGSDIPSLDVTSSAPVMTFLNKVAKTSISDFDQLNFVPSMLAAYAEDHAKAIGRQEDQFIFDALTSGVSAAKTIPNGGDNMTIAKMIEAQQMLADDEVDGDEMFLVMHSKNYRSLLGEIEFVNNLYTDTKALVGNVPIVGYKGKFLDFNIIVVGNRTEGGLPVAANIRKTFAFAKSSVLAGYRWDPKTSMTYVPQNVRTEVLSTLSMGAMVRDNLGVVEIDCDES